MTTTIKRSHIIILLAACLFAAGSTFFLWPKQPSFAYQCFKTEQGWGYDILAGKKILIHQPVVPGVAGRAGFDNEELAASVAQIVIEKIKSGQMPVISHERLQRLGVLPAQIK